MLLEFGRCTRLAHKVGVIADCHLDKPVHYVLVVLENAQVCRMIVQISHHLVDFTLGQLVEVAVSHEEVLMGLAFQHPLDGGTFCFAPALRRFGTGKRPPALPQVG